MKDQLLWKSLLELKKKIRDFSNDLSFVFLSKSQSLLNEIPKKDEAFGCFIIINKEIKLTTSATVFQLHDFIELEFQNGDSLSNEEVQFLKIYLPYCFLAYRSKQLKRCIAVAHFAQSLDGKIATHKGDSRWIGNDENLIHAHRMRALCEGIIVGSNTVQADKPQLTVRRVEGDNPLRIIIGSSALDLSSLMACCADPILVVSNKTNYESKQVRYLRIPSDNCHINGLDLLKVLFENGIYSIYIEGGARTTSNFLMDNAIDILQLHLSPIIFGSGKQGIVLPQIGEVKDSQQFSSHDFYKIGDSIMFVGSR